MSGGSKGGYACCRLTAGAAANPAGPARGSVLVTSRSPRPCFLVRRSYHFNYPSTVTLLQILVSLVFMYALRAAGTMQFSGLTLQGARKVGRRLGRCKAGQACILAGGWCRRAWHHSAAVCMDGLPKYAAAMAPWHGADCLCATTRLRLRSLPPQVAPLAFFWWLYVVSGVTALRHLNVPMYRCGGLHVLMRPPCYVCCVPPPAQGEQSLVSHPEHAMLHVPASRQYTSSALQRDPAFRHAAGCHMFATMH